MGSIDLVSQFDLVFHFLIYHPSRFSTFDLLIPTKHTPQLTKLQHLVFLYDHSSRFSPAAFPIRLLFQIFVMIPISMIIQVYQALQPLFVFITSAVTLGVLMGLAGGLSHAILGDWMQTYFTSSLSASRSSVAPTPAPTRRKITSGVRPPIKISGRKRISESPETQWAHGLDFASSSALELKPRLSSRSSTTSSTNTSSIMKGSRQHRSSVSPSSVLSTRSSSDGSMSVISSTKGKKKVTFKND